MFERKRHFALNSVMLVNDNEAGEANFLVNWDSRSDPPGPEVNANATSLDMIAGIDGLYYPQYKTFPQCKSEGDHDV